MNKKSVNNLTKIEINAAVAFALGITYTIVDDLVFLSGSEPVEGVPPNGAVIWDPVEKIQQAWPIIKRERISLIANELDIEDNGEYWYSQCEQFETDDDEPLSCGMKVFLFKKLGPEIDIDLIMGKKMGDDLEPTHKEADPAQRP